MVQYLNGDIGPREVIVMVVVVCFFKLEKLQNVYIQMKNVS